jgi:hypothetical protein
LAILLSEGPQDKKSSIDLYYGRYQTKFPDEHKLAARLKNYLSWIVKTIPDLSKTRYRKPVDLYALIVAIDRIVGDTSNFSKLTADAGIRLRDFDKQTRVKVPTNDAARYVAAASRQTDNLTPRTTRIEVLRTLLRA